MVRINAGSLLNAAFVLLLLCSSCCNKAELSYTLDSFKTGKLEKVRTYDCAAFGIDNPASLKVHPSGRLLLLERGAAAQLKIINLSDGTVSGLLSRGRGPGEAVTPWDLSVTANGEVWVSDIATRKLISFTCSDDGAFSYCVERKFQNQFMRALPFGDKETLMLASSSSGDRMYVADADGVAVDTVGSFPYSTVLDKSVLCNSVFQSDLAATQDGEEVIVCCKSFNVIDIYNSDFTGCRRLTGPETMAVGVKARETPMGVMYAQKPFVKIFDGISAGSEEFMVAYVGAYTDEEVLASGGASRLLLFEKGGSPSEVFEVPVPFSSFDVDWSNGKVYLVTYEDSPKIEVYGFR